MERRDPKANNLLHGSWPATDLEIVGQCPVCKKNERSLLYEGLSDTALYAAPGLWTLYRCSNCRSAFLDPRPTEATISRAYVDYHTHGEVNSRATGWSKCIKQSVKRGYMNSRYCTGVSPFFKVWNWVVILSAQQRKMDELFRHLPVDNNHGKLADIGCGNGDFLYWAAQIGWRVVGIDNDPLAVEAALRTGATVQIGGFPRTGLASAEFDIVTLNHVIEHVHDPLGALMESLRVLRPGGRVWIATPNLNSLGHSRFRSSWRGLEPPRHLVIFTPESLKNALERVGFESVQQKAAAPNTLWFYDVSYRASVGTNHSGFYFHIKRGFVVFISSVAWLREMLSPHRNEVLIVMATKPVTSQ